MQKRSKKNIFKKEKTIVILFFTFVVMEVITELLSIKAILFAFRPSIALLLLYLYWTTSKERNKLFFATVFFLLLTSILIIWLTKAKIFLVLGVIGILIHRILLIYYILKLNRSKDFVPIVLATIPFIFIFSYLLSISDEIPDGSYFPLLAQNILVSILAGVILSNYFMNENNNSPWLFIFGLLSTAMHFIVFIEKYFLSNLPATYFKPIGMVLYATSYYSFYKFVTDTEKSKLDLSTEYR